MRNIILCFVLLIHSQVSGQDLSGYWHGVLPQSDKSFDFSMKADIKQKENVITGTLKYEDNNRQWVIMNFYGQINGVEVTFTEYEVIRSTQGWNWCLKNMKGTLTVDRRSNKLIIEGSWHSNRLYSNKTYYEGYCAPGKFKIEKPNTNNKKIKPTENNTVRIPDTISKALRNYRKDSLYKTDTSHLHLDRVIEVIKVFDVFSDSLALHFYDDGQIDNDTITVYFNRSLLMHKQRLTGRPVTVHVSISAEKNEILLYADNVGSVPPNTALMVFYDQGVRRSVKINSDTQKTSAIIFRKVYK